MNQDLERALAAGNQGPGVGTYIVIGLIAIVMIAAVWRVFTKAGKPGWASLIPIYNTIVLLDIAGKPAWWVILFFLPFVNFIMLCLTYAGLAKNFGKGGGFTVGLILLGPIFIAILGFGGAQYQAAAPARAVAA
jgi:hypothetical protein